MHIIARSYVEDHKNYENFRAFKGNPIYEGGI